MIKKLLASVFMVVAAGIGLTGCSDKSEPAVVPVAMVAPDDATGYYCGMLLPEHSGPKGQIHLSSRTEPIWFTSVHDTIVFMRLPEEPRDISAVYVHDMGQISDWDHPDDIWVNANDAWFVINSNMLGGMGMKEAVPFSTEEFANQFVEKHGGNVMRLTDIPDEYFSGLSEGGVQHDFSAHDDHGDSGHGH